MMLIRICDNQPKLALRIVQTGCTGGQLLDLGVMLDIYPASCPHPLYSPQIWCGCFVDNRVPVSGCCDVPLQPPPTLTYPAFALDEEGRIVFYFDKKLWSMPSGRYHASVRFERGDCIAEFDIDLCCRPAVIDQAAVTDAKSCGS